MDPAAAFFTTSDRPMHSADVRSRFLGSPIRYSEPDARHWEERGLRIGPLRSELQGAVYDLRDVLAQREANTDPAKDVALQTREDALRANAESIVANLKNLGVQEETLSAWVTSNTRAEAETKLTEQQKREFKQAKAGIAPTDAE